MSAFSGKGALRAPSPRVTLARALTLLWLLSAAACGLRPSSDSRPVQSRYLTNRGSDTIVVFFHGIFGDPTGTWRAAEASESFADLVAGDSVLGRPDVFLVGYPTPLFGKALNIEENAEKVKQDLFDQGVFRRRTIVFITHSMGGLVARRIVTKLRGGERESLGRIKAVLLFAVPVHGATVAERTYWASNNPQLRDLRPEEVNALLQSWERDWQDMYNEADSSLRRGHAIEVPAAFCAYETTKLGPVTVVPSLYTTTRCETFYPLPLNHSQIVKPTDRGSDPYPWAVARIRQALSRELTPNPIPDAIPDQTGWLYLADYSPRDLSFSRGPFFTGGSKPLPKRGDILTLTIQRHLIIANYRTSGGSNRLVAPWRVKKILDPNDETGVVLPAGTRVEVRDVSTTQCLEERGPEVSCSLDQEILWVRVANPPR